MLKSKRKLIPLVIGLNLIPSIAFAQTAPVTAPTTAGADLTAAQLTSAFMDFSASIENRESAPKAVLRGLVYEECAFKFEFYESKSALGFGIRDLGGLKCMEDLRKQTGDKCNAPVDGKKTACVKLSSIPGASIDLSSKASGEVSLVNHDKDPAKAESFATKLEHKSLAEVRKELEEKRQESLAKKVALWEEQAKKCRRNEADLTIGRAAVNSLFRAGSITGDQKDEMLDKLAGAELMLLNQAIEEVEPENADDLKDIRDRLAALAETNPGIHEKLATLYYRIAHKYRDLRGMAAGLEEGDAIADADFLEEASETIGEAMKLDGLSAKSKKAMNVHRLELMAAMTSESEFKDFNKSYRDLSKELNKAVKQECRGRQPSDFCMQLQNLAMQSQQMPQQMIAREQQRRQEEAQRYEQMRMGFQPTNAQAMSSQGFVGGAPTVPNSPMNVNPAQPGVLGLGGGAQWSNWYDSGLAQLPQQQQQFYNSPAAAQAQQQMRFTPNQGIRTSDTFFSNSGRS